MSDIAVTRTVTVREADLHETFLAGSGPGGQHANKVATSVQLRVALSALPERLHARLREIAGGRINREGEIVIEAARHRSRERNRADARERLAALIREAAQPPPPKRRPTRPTRGSVKRRLDGKTKRGAVKKLRGRVRGE